MVLHFFSEQVKAKKLFFDNLPKEAFAITNPSAHNAMGDVLATALVEAVLFTDATAYDIIFFFAAAHVMRPEVRER